MKFKLASGIGNRHAALWIQQDNVRDTLDVEGFEQVRIPGVLLVVLRPRDGL